MSQKHIISNRRCKNILTMGGGGKREGECWADPEKEPRTQRVCGRPRYGCRDKNSPVWPRCSLSFHVPVSNLHTHIHTHIHTFLSVSYTLHYINSDENKNTNLHTQTETHPGSDLFSYILTSTMAFFFFLFHSHDLHGTFNIYLVS